MMDRLNYIVMIFYISGIFSRVVKVFLLMVLGLFLLGCIGCM